MGYRIVTLLLRWLGRQRKSTPINPAQLRSLLVVELTRLGDVVTVAPCLQALREHYPLATVHVVVEKKHMPVIAAIGGEYKFIGVDGSGTIAGFWRLVRKVRSLQPDLACSMSPGRRNAALVLSSGARWKAGYLTDSDSITPFLGEFPVEAIGFRQAARVAFRRENISRRPLKVLEVLGLHPTNGQLPGKASRQRMSVVPRKQGGPAGKQERRYVSIHPFSGWEYRTWSAENFAALAKSITRKLKCDVVFVSSAAELDKESRLASLCGPRKEIRFFHSDNLARTMDVLKGSKAFVGNDSGPLHLAALLGVPVVGLFGPAPPELTAPPADRKAYLYKKVECSPCNQRSCVRPANPCLAAITPGEVLAALERVLARTPARSKPHG